MAVPNVPTKTYLPVSKLTPQQRKIFDGYKTNWQKRAYLNKLRKQSVKDLDKAAKQARKDFKLRSEQQQTSEARLHKTIRQGMGQTTATLTEIFAPKAAKQLSGVGRDIQSIFQNVNGGTTKTDDKADKDGSNLDNQIAFKRSGRSYSRRDEE